MSKNRISIKDVAKDAGVGVGTVSRVINDTGSISEETKEKVRRSIEKLGYSPNRVAQSMRSQKYKNIACFVALRNTTFSRIANGIYNQLEDQGYLLSLFNIDSNNVADKIHSFMSGGQFDGIILAPPNEKDEKLIHLLKSYDIPIVTLEMEIPGIPDSINVNYSSSIRKAVKYLLSLGHHKTALLCGSEVVKANHSIIQTFKEAFAENNITIHPDQIILRSPSDEKNAQSILNILYKIKSGEVTSVVCMNTPFLHRFLQMLKDNNLKYPDDVSVIAIEDYELTRLLNPSMTVIRRSLFDIGTKISQILLYYINHPESYGKLPPYNIPTEFITRESCKAIE